jgi:uncharacterized repeat protein (TIGR03803 family)
MRMFESRCVRSLCSLFGFAMLSFTVNTQAFGGSEKVLFSFGVNATHGLNPWGRLIMDKSGNLYGTTLDGGIYGGSRNLGGTVFKLTRPSAGHGWGESILWNFGNGSDGGGPFAGVITDTNGNLYGTADVGGVSGLGIVFRLAPPSTSGGTWTESVLWNFGGGTDGGNPQGGLIMDQQGNLYGATTNGGIYSSGGGFAGTVFKLTPPSTSGGTWTESILWNFGNGTDGSQPLDTLAMDKIGNLYGTTVSGGDSGQGTVFKLMPPSTTGGNWTESVLWSFGSGVDGAVPTGGVILDSSGSIYGTT